MKKLFLVLALIAGSFSAVGAQGFEPQVKVNGMLGIDTYKNHSFGAEFLAGYRFNPQVRVGLGAGIDYCNLKYEGASKYRSEYKESAAYVPVFANGKFNFIDNNVSPYFSADVGYAIFIPGSGYAEDNKLGMFFKPAFGVDFSMGKGALFVEVCYNYQMRDFNGTRNYNQIGLAVGYQF